MQPGAREGRRTNPAAHLLHMQGDSDSQKSNILTVAQSSQVRDPFRLDLDLLCCMMCYSKLALLLEKKNK